jgi:hypothetical protein
LQCQINVFLKLPAHFDPSPQAASSQNEPEVFISLSKYQRLI